MIQKNKKQYAFMLLFFIVKIVFAQIDNEKTLLIKAIPLLEEKYSVKFNYASNQIETITITLPPKNLKLEEVLIYLRNQTLFNFTLINDDIISIKKETNKVCGYIKNVETNKAISGVSVFVSNSNNSVSNDSGYFSIPIKNNDKTIEISHIGYEKINLLVATFTSNNCLEIKLRPKTETLSQVTISGYLVDGIDKKRDGSKLIDFSKFSTLPGLIEPDVLQSIQSLPGILSADETVSNINIRGGTHDQNLILWDNIKMYQSSHFFGLISSFNPQITKQVSLINNGTDASLTDGVSGTINMLTDNKINKKLKANFGVNFINADAYMDIPINNKSSLQIAARKSVNDWIETPTFKRYFKRISQVIELQNENENILSTDKSFDFYDTSFRWLYTFSNKDILKVNFIQANNKLGFKKTTKTNNIEDIKNSTLSQNSIASGIYYKKIINNKHHADFHIYETDYKLKAVNTNVFESQRFLQENSVSETGIKINSYYNPKSQTLQFQNGYHFVETKVTNLSEVNSPIFKELIANVVRTHALFSQLKYLSSNDATRIKTGLRLNYIDKFNKIILEPRLSLSHQVFTNFSIELLGEFKHQNTSQVINFQNDFLGIEKRRWLLANDKDIPILKSKQLALGLSYMHSGLVIDINGYYKNVKGITTQSQGFQTKYEFVKTNGNYYVYGLDLLVRKKIKNFITWFSYSLMDNNYRFNTLTEGTFPSNFDITNALTFGASFNTKHLKLSTGLNWRTGKPTTAPLEGNEVASNGQINFNDANSSKLNDYLRVDFSVLYKIKPKRNWHSEVGLSIWNITNKNNTIENFYRVNENDQINEFNKNALGITTNFVFRIYIN